MNFGIIAEYVQILFGLSTLTGSYLLIGLRRTLMKFCFYLFDNNLYIFQKSIDIFLYRFHLLNLRLSQLDFTYVTHLLYRLFSISLLL